MTERTYSVDEANAMLSELEEILPAIREARQVVLRAGERIKEMVASDGGGHEGTEYWNAIRTLRGHVEHLAELGILLRDPETGLVDFPGELDGRRVYLCWRLGETRVGHWHDLESGFAGRRPLP
ncbi:MAG TPA: DUF2203 domain-containing protein [Actinomycetota bacterium]|nr:DUF2203 domain-containing protein [Actinomycetota bacterium]